ncbi:MAG TPA: nucleotidyltransferase family protein [Terriglobia bacterium]|nr:nucleotidyltransferase family protein [Terriglobia bacterium]
MSRKYFPNVHHICVVPSDSIRVVISRMNNSRLGIALVVNDQDQLLGTVTDGDIRRAALANINFDEPVRLLLERKADSKYAKPISAITESDPGLYLAVLKQHDILHLPLIDAQGRVADLVTLHDFLPAEPLPPLQAVIMAGGAGTRLLPLTENTPKPMLLVGGRPLMEITIEQLRDAGVRQINISTHYAPEKITEHFGNGQHLGIELSYIAEDRPLGTAGALGLLKCPDHTTLVINGDILTGVDFRAMAAFHREHSADLTIAVRQYGLQVPYGVVECDGAAVRQLTEKPALSFLVNAGIYLLEPPVYQYIPQGERIDMTDLIQRLLNDGRKIVSFPVHEYWLDIGQPSDYQVAQDHAKSTSS